METTGSTRSPSLREGGAPDATAPVRAHPSGRERIAVPPRRHTVYARNHQEVNLVFFAEAILLEWLSEGVPAPETAHLLPGHAPLQPVPSLLEGGRCWRLPPLPADPPAPLPSLQVVLEGPAGRLEVFVAHA